MPPLEQQLLPAIATGSDSSAGQSRWSVRRWVWMSGMASIAVFVLGGVYAVPAAVSSPDYSAPQSGFSAGGLASSDDDHIDHDHDNRSGSGPGSGLRPGPGPGSPPRRPRPAPAVLASATAAPAAPALPAYGHATAWGCAAALAYLQAYAAPGFALDCPGYAEGHEAMTCLHGTPQYPDACLNGPEIAISDACPQAYMNESANSWLLTGQTATEQAKFGVSYSSIDPFGACP